jgi:hypothetical protein
MPLARPIVGPENGRRIAGEREQRRPEEQGQRRQQITDRRPERETRFADLK